MYRDKDTPRELRLMGQEAKGSPSTDLCPYIFYI